jgi:hypothetical protein
MERSTADDDLKARRNGKHVDRSRELALIGLALEKLFQQANGRRGDTDEVLAWFRKQELPAPIDPYAVLTPEEIAAVDALLE